MTNPALTSTSWTLSKPHVSWKLAVVVAVILAALLALLAIPLGQGHLRFRATIQPQVIMWGLWLLLLPLVLAAARRAHTFGVLTWRGIVTHVGAGLLLSLAHGTLWGVVRWQLTPEATRNLPKMVAIMISFLYGGDLLRYVVIVAAYHAHAFSVEAKERALAEARLTARLAEARLEALEARLHPHFLFNTLNAITSMIRTNPSGAIEVVENLGDLLRAALRAEPGRKISVTEEVELLRRYIAIQQMRFSDRLRVDMNIDSSARRALMPQMLLQPIVENAIQHGIAPREAPGTVTIAIERRGQRLHLLVRDDGVGLGGARVGSSDRSRRTTTGIGISNSRQRLVELYAQDFSLELLGAPAGGTVVNIDIPYAELNVT